MRDTCHRSADLLRLFLVIILLCHGTAVAEDRALLIGCTNYPGLPRSAWLRGGVHDVKLMKSLLMSDRFNFDEADIKVLSGWSVDAEASRPTFANISKAIAELTEQTEAGDHVVILFSGHGSQQPANQDSRDRETDGYDELFIPADVGAWDNTNKAVSNAIVDDQIRGWLKALTDKGSLVWVMFDSCHSGTMIRGTAARATKERRLDPGLLVPAAAMEVATRGGPRSRGPETLSEDVSELTRGMSGVVAMYAAQSSEPTYEKALPGANDPIYGMFTYTVAQVIFQSQGSLTYRELAERVVARYRAGGILQPTPLVEGTKLDRAVLGADEWPDRPAILISGTPANGPIFVAAGHLHGLRPGTVLAVYPQAGKKNADKRIGHIRITRASPLRSVAQAFRFEDYPQASEFEPGSRCQIVYVDYGDMRLKIGVQTQQQHDAGKDAIVSVEAGEGPDLIEAAVTILLQETLGLVTREEDPAKADWFIRSVGEQVVLVPASGWPANMLSRGGAHDPDILNTKYALAEAKDATHLAVGLFEAFTRIARARQLLNLAALTAEGGRLRRAAVDVRLDMRRYEDDTDVKGEPVPHSGPGRVLHNGDLVSFTVTNISRHSVDVTLLFVDSGYGITTIFPEPGTIDDNRIAPGETFALPRIEVTAETVGAEQIVAIAVKSGRERQDFSSLEQPTLEQARSTGNDLASPLGQLMQRAMYGKGNTRGLRRSDVDNYSVRLLPWLTMPANSTASAAD